MPVPGVPAVVKISIDKFSSCPRGAQPTGGAPATVATTASAVARHGKLRSCICYTVTCYSCYCYLQIVTAGARTLPSVHYSSLFPVATPACTPMCCGWSIRTPTKPRQPSACRRTSHLADTASLQKQWLASPAHHLALHEMQNFLRRVASCNRSFPSTLQSAF